MCIGRAAVVAAVVSVCVLGGAGVAVAGDYDDEGGHDSDVVIQHDGDGDDQDGSDDVRSARSCSDAEGITVINCLDASDLLSLGEDD